jgi:hypothetical protein
MMASSSRYGSILSSEMKLFCDKASILSQSTPLDLSICHDWVIVSIGEVEALVNRMKGTDYLLQSPAYTLPKQSYISSPYQKPP